MVLATKRKGNAVWVGNVGRRAPLHVLRSARAWRQTLGTVVSRVLRSRAFGKYNFLNLPIVFKVVIANSLLVGMGILAGIWLVHTPLWQEEGDMHLSLMLISLVISIGISAAVNYAIVKTAMTPLSRLQQTVAAVRSGDLGARAERHPLEDPAVEFLTSTLNDMLDKMAHDKQRLESLSAGLIAAHEEERKRVARDLHDEVGQMITALLIRLKLLQKTSSFPGGPGTLEDTLALAAAACEAVGRVAYEMRPSILDDLGLVAALEAFIETCCGRKPGISVKFQVRNMDQRLPAPMELALYRIVREALWNVGRHSQATHVRVLLEKESTKVTALVEDNGAGFDVKKILQSPRSAIGLLGLQERAAILGGTVRVDSRPGAGTRVYVEIPLA